VKVDAKTFLRLVEKAGTLQFLDIESTGLRGDYNSALVVSIRPVYKAARAFVVEKPGRDRAMLKAVKAALEAGDCWVTYYGKGFDIKMLNTRLLRWGIPPIEPRPHLDLYYMLKSNTLMARRSQGHYLNWLRLPEQKMSVSAEAWNEVLDGNKKALATMRARCNSDTAGLEALYHRTKHLIKDINR